MTRKRLDDGLTFRFITVIGSIVAVLLGVLYFVSVMIVGRTTELQYRENLADISEARTHELVEWIEIYADELRMYSGTDAVKSGDSGKIQSWLTSGTISLHDGSSGLSFVDRKGRSADQTGTVTDVSGSVQFSFVLANHPDLFVSDPFTSGSAGTSVFQICRSVYDVSKNFIGYLAVSVPVESLRKTIGAVKIGDRGYAFIIDGRGGIITQQEVHCATLASGRSASGWVGNQKDGTDWLEYSPVSGTQWTLVLSVPRSQIRTAVTNLGKTLTFTIIIILVIAVACTSFYLIARLKPLKDVDSALAEISTGSADLTSRISVAESRDEIGSVVKGFNTFVGELQTIIKDVKTSKDRLASVDGVFQQSTENTSSSIVQIIANIDDMGNQITNQSASVEETAGSVNQIASNISALENMIETQSASVSEASAAVEQMIGNIQSVNQSVEKMASSFSGLDQNAQSGAMKQKDVDERIDQIEKQSEMLQDANTAIASIAEQTNLLAMNAAIEAAHAGAAGRGFSVVADEIRKLSETSSAQSKTIGQQLTKIKDSIGGVVAASAESNKAFQSVSTQIRETDELVRQIRAAMQEQETGSRQITESLHSMSESTEEVKTASSEMSAGNKAIIEEVKRLQDATAVMKDCMNEMSAGAQKISQAGKSLADISGRMRESIRDIGSQIDLFKV